jgi:hypothetical protein
LNVSASMIAQMRPCQLGSRPCLLDLGTRSRLSFSDGSSEFLQIPVVPGLSRYKLGWLGSSAASHQPPGNADLELLNPATG